MAITEREATSRINAVLAELEAATQQVVESISVESLDVTSYGDRRRQVLRTVRIDLKPIPGSQWQA